MATGLLPLVTEIIKDKLGGVPTVEAGASMPNQYRDGFVGGAPYPVTPEARQTSPQSFDERGWTPLSTSGDGGAGGIGGFFRGVLNDPERMAKIGLALNSMSTRPDAGYAQAMNDQLKMAQATKVGNKTATVIAQQLRAMGQEDMAKLVEANPASAKDILKQYVQSKYAKSASPTASGVQIDPKTGKMFQVIFNPATGKSEMQEIEGAYGETPDAKSKREADQQAFIGGQKMAADKAALVYGRASSVGEQINKLQQARQLVAQGAQTGVIRSFLPSFNAATAGLRSIANSLGIDIINSATFGALSEKELSLALSTGLDLSLSGDALQKHIQDKINAQEKLYNQLMGDAQQLSTGITYNEYIQMRASKRRESPIPVYGGGAILPESLKSQMDASQIEAFNKLPLEQQQRFINGQ